MIISRTPLRISFCGGGTDIPSFYENYGGGEVVSATINKYVYIMAHERFDKLVRFVSFKIELVDQVKKMEEKIVKEALLEAKISDSTDVMVMTDIPPGTGMGSSGSFTVGLLNALHLHNNREVTKTELAEMACDIEINKLNQPIGKQDQYAAAFGGFNVLKFNPDGEVVRSEVAMGQDNITKLQEHSLLFFLEKKRSATKILEAQERNVEQNVSHLKKMKAFVPEAVMALRSGNMVSLGQILHKNWELKKRLTSSVTDEDINNYYGKALSAGAYGGKVLGAGGGGFLFFICPKDKRESVKSALGLREINFEFEQQGSTIVG